MTGHRHAALVTGASTGIGRASVRALLDAGLTVFAGARREESLDSLADEPGDVQPLLLDVGDHASIENARQQVASVLGSRPLRAVVNNAGISHAGPLELMDRREIEAVVAIDLLAPLWVTRAFLPMLEAPGGRVVNIGSGEGFISLPINGAYAMAKRGLEAQSDALRLELAPGGSFVSVVVPGGVATPILEKGVARFRSLLAQRGPMEQYHDQIRGRSRIAERGLSGRGPESTARRVTRAVTEARPKAHYFVSWDAWTPALLSRLPTRFRDTLLRFAVS